LQILTKRPGFAFAKEFYEKNQEKEEFKDKEKHFSKKEKEEIEKIM
jgi:hypothetical protein